MAKVDSRGARECSLRTEQEASNSSDVKMYEWRVQVKYRQATGSRPAQVEIPPGVNPREYRLTERMAGARKVIQGLPVPRNALEARYRIQSPSGQPFPLNLPQWANFWHFQDGRRAANGRLRGGRKATQYDVCKLMWMEGFAQLDFPPL